MPAATLCNMKNFTRTRNTQTFIGLFKYLFVKLLKNKEEYPVKYYLKNKRFIKAKQIELNG